MSRMEKLYKKYPYLVEWHRRTGSYTYYINWMVEAAEKDNAPEDVVYQETGAGGKPGKWVRINECNLNPGTLGHTVKSIVEGEQK